MKKIIGVSISLIMLLAGCSNGVTKENHSNKTSVNYGTASENDKNSNQRTQSGIGIQIDNTKSPFEKGYYDYEGTIGNNSIQMSIYPLETGIVGSYFYDSKRIEIKLKGEAGAKDIVLNEYNEEGKKTGTFKGTMNAVDEVDKVDKIEGTWISANSKNSYPFKLTVKSILSGTDYGKRYAAAVGKESDKDVENYVSKIQSYIKNNDKEQLAEQVSYPIKAKINAKVTEIKNKYDFIKHYEQIFYSDYKKKLSNAYTKYLFANYQGIMFGENLDNIWINEIGSKLMITTINN